MSRSRRTPPPARGEEAAAGPAADAAAKRSRAPRRSPAKEIGGPEGPEPTRYGDWERNGRCTDF